MATKINKKIEQEILKKVRSFISEGTAHCEDKHKRSEENQKYTRGEQWNIGDIARQEQRERPAIPWNSVFKVVHAISNREMVERFIPKVFGRDELDNGVANILDEACRWQREMSASEQYESMAFRSAAISGYGWMHKYWNAAAMNGDGMISDEDVPTWEMLWPARARQPNLSDRRWHVRGKWMDIEQIESRWGDISHKLRKQLKIWRGYGKMADLGVMTDTDTSLRIGSNTISFGWEGVRVGKWINKAMDEAFVIEAEWIELENAYKAAVPIAFDQWVAFQNGTPLEIPGQVDPETGQPGPPQYIELGMYQQMLPEEQEAFMDQILFETEWKEFESRQELNEFLDLYEQTTGREFEDFKNRPKEVVRYAIIIENMVLDYGIRPFGYSYYCITGFPFESRDGAEFYGAVDIVKGPQDYKNALLSNMLAMYMSSPKAPIIIERSAVPNIGEFMDQIASPSSVAVVPDGFFANSRFQIMESPNYPPMIGPLMEITSSGVEEALGLSSIDIGAQADLRRVSGTVVQAAKTASNVIVAILFDSLRMFRRQYGLCNVRFINKMYTIEEIIRIVGEDKIDDLANVPPEWGDVFKYDIVIDEQPTTPTEMMELMDFLTRTGTLDNWLNGGHISFEDVMRLMPQIPESEKRKILKNKTLKDQLMQMQQQMQITQEQFQALIRFLHQHREGHNILTEFDLMQQARGLPETTPSGEGEEEG